MIEDPRDLGSGQHTSIWDVRDDLCVSKLIEAYCTYLCPTCSHVGWAIQRMYKDMFVSNPTISLQHHQAFDRVSLTFSQIHEDQTICDVGVGNGDTLNVSTAYLGVLPRPGVEQDGCPKGLALHYLDKPAAAAVKHYGPPRTISIRFSTNTGVVRRSRQCSTGPFVCKICCEFARGRFKPGLQVWC